MHYVVLQFGGHKESSCAQVQARDLSIGHVCDGGCGGKATPMLPCHPLLCGLRDQEKLVSLPSAGPNSRGGRLRCGSGN